MVQLLQKRDRKETRNCESCGKPKMKSYFYDWYSAFDGSFLAVVCLNCAKRETGSKHKLERYGMTILQAMLEENESLEKQVRIAIEGLSLIKESNDPMNIARETLDAIAKVKQEK